MSTAIQFTIKELFGYVGFVHTNSATVHTHQGFYSLIQTQASLHLQVLSKRLRLSGDFNFHAIAKLTPGFVGADLAALTKEAAAIAVTRIFEQLDGSAAAAAAQQALALDGALLPSSG